MSSRFTLIEVLIASTISVIVLGVISGTAWSTLQSVNITERRVDASMENSALIRRLSEDLRWSRLNVQRSFAEEEMLDEGQLAPPTFYAKSKGDELILNIYTTAAITGPYKPAGVYKVRYRLEDGNLERRQANIAQIDLDALPWRLVAEELDFIEMSFFDGQQWLPEWDSNEEHALPLLIEVRIGRRRNGVRAGYEFIVSPAIMN